MRKCSLNFFFVVGLAVLSGCAPVSRTPEEKASEPQPKAGETRVNPIDGLTYVWIPPGKATIGCPVDDCRAGEQPAHAAEIYWGFWMGQTPVTVGAWKRYRAATGAGALRSVEWEGRKMFNEDGGDDNLPVVQADWEDAQKFCNWGDGVLPSEEEWEYAARAGASSFTYENLDAIAWYGDNSGKRRIDAWALLHSTSAADYVNTLFRNGAGPHPVAGKAPNAWGLYDMVGNVVQWTEDVELGRSLFDARYRYFLRGCSWMHPAATCRVTFRQEALDVGQALKTAPDLQSAVREMNKASALSGFRCVVSPDSWPKPPEKGR